MTMSSFRPLLLTAFLPFLAWCQTPGLVYSRMLPIFSGGNTTSGVVSAIAVDAAGNAYLAGSTQNQAFPVTPGAPQTSFGGGTCTDPTYNPFLPPITHPCDDAFVLELDPRGNVVFGTYLGGSAFDQATGIAVDSSGNIYVAGTAGHNFPTTPGGPFGDSTTATTFLVKINPATGLVYSYLIPGLDGKILVALDAQGNVYFAGHNSGFATTLAAHQGKGGIAVGKLNPAGTKLVYGAQFGGTNGAFGESVAGIAVDSSGNAYITGATSTTDFPATAGAYQTILPDRLGAAFVAKLNASGSALVYGTYLGAGDFDTAASQIRVDAQGEAYVLGQSASTGFLSKLKPDGSGLVFSMNPLFTVSSFDIDSAGNVFLAGQGGPGLPVTAGATQSCLGGGGSDIFVAEFSPQGKLAAASYLGGSGYDSSQAIAVNPDGTVTLAGNTSSLDFSVTMGPEPWIDYVVARLQIADASRPERPCMSLALQNGASFIEGPIAPGELVTLRGNHFGPDTAQPAAVDSTGRLPAALAGVRVFFDTTPAPLLYVQSQQINVQAPFELAGRKSTSIHVEYQGVSSQTAQIAVQDAAPDFFRLLPSQQGVIFNSDGSLNSPSNPAPVGSAVWILGTGGGLFAPPIPTGAMAPFTPLSKLALTPTVLIDAGVPAQVQYAGSSPTAPSGVFQINFVVPPVVTYPFPHTVDVTIGPGSTNPLQTVSIAIRQ
jgi:uncharacterized protein (TIGR03437 family)